MLALYLVSFWVGLLLTLVFSLLGSVGHGGHGRLSPFHGHVHGPHGHAGPTPVNLTTILGFLTGFGGVGYILDRQGLFAGVVSLLFAILAGLLIAGILFFALAKLFLRGERVMNEAEYDLVGVIGQVNATIPEGGIGEIKFTLQDTIRAIGARSNPPNRIPRGTKVVIRQVEKGIATVEEFENFMGKTDS